MKAGWKSNQLGETVQFVDYRGKTPPKVELGIRLITAKNVKMGYIQREPLEFIDPAVYDTWMTRGYPRRGDVLFTTEAPLGNVAQLDTDETVVIGQRLITMKVNPETVDSAFLKYALLSPQMQEQIRLRATGATVSGIKASLLRKVPFSYPSLAEQKRIVAILDEAFEGLARARTYAESNTQDSSRLYWAGLDTVFKVQARSWPQVRLPEVCADFGRGKSQHRPRNDPKLYGGTVPFIQTGEISRAGHFINTCEQTYSQFGLAQSKKWPRGTVCIAIVGATIGESAILDFEACFPDSVIGMNPDVRKADPEYIYYLLQYYKPQLKEAGKGSARDNINLATFTDRLFPMPEYDVQRCVVESLNDLAVSTENLANAYKQSVDDIDILRQSLLQKAFSGELT